MRKRMLWMLVATALFIACDKEESSDLSKIYLSAQINYLGEPLQVKNKEILYVLLEKEPMKGVSAIQSMRLQWNGVCHTEVDKGRNYQLVRTQSAVPWVYLQTSDTLSVHRYKGAMIDIKVMPYYLLKDVSIQRKGLNITAQAVAQDVIGFSNHKKIEKVVLFLSSGLIVDCENTELGSVELTQVKVGEKLTLQYTLTENLLSPTSRKVYARMGLKIAGIAPMIYSAPFEV